jgi:predicted porin
MKKSLVALAALAVSGAAMAQVTISGRANLDVGGYTAVGATGRDSIGTAGAVALPAALDAANRNVVRDASSRITLTVNEDLGGGRTAALARPRADAGELRDCTDLRPQPADPSVPG